MKQYAYKVVELNYDGKLVSTAALNKTIYLLNRFVSRKEGFGPLCLFKTREAARKYKRYINVHTVTKKFVIYKSEYLPSEDIRIWEFGRSSTIEYQAILFAEQDVNITEKDFVLADKVKLLRKVY